MSFVVDAALSLAWCFGQESGARATEGNYAARVLDALRNDEAVTASHWSLEVAHGLLAAERRGRIRADEVTRVTRFLLALPISLDPREISRAGTATFRLARTRGLSVYDAAYLEVAMRLGLPIATLSRDLRISAGTEGVDIFQPGRRG
jgi:predicted nucleic acid-binding protein